jgi:adenylylsulfate kinase-like enzyme
MRPVSEGVVWEKPGTTREQRWAATGLRGATIWMTGLPASGKSTLVVVSLISPYAAQREHVREIHAEHDLPFVEVWVSTPLEECERRDPKGLYARARRGELRGMTGIDDPYEAPERPDLEIRPAEHDDAVERVLSLLRERDVIN